MICCWLLFDLFLFFFGCVSSGYFSCGCLPFCFFAYFSFGFIMMILFRFILDFVLILVFVFTLVWMFICAVAM